jgi:hypothetical protein
VRYDRIAMGDDVMGWDGGEGYYAIIIITPESGIL